MDQVRGTGAKTMLVRFTAAIVALGCFSFAYAQEKVRIGVGTLTEVSGGSLFATRTYLEKSKLFEQTAKKFGYDVEVKWLTFPFAPELVSAAAAGDVQIGTIASFPIIRQISLGQQIYPLQLAWAGWRNLIVVRKGGSVKSFEDLKGKTIGVALGTTLEAFVRTFIQLELGASAEELGIKLVSQPFPVPTMPRGMDALLTFYPAFLQVEDKGDLQILVDSFGTTGPGYEGPLGKGAGILVPSAKKSPFWPEGYAVSRGYWVLFGDLARQHPKLVEAWLIANESAFRTLSKMPLKEFTEYFPGSLWTKVSREGFENKFLKPELLLRRGWTWPTEGEIDLMADESNVLNKMGALKSSLSKDDIRKNYEPIIPLLLEAYKALGSYPPRNVFLDSSAQDKRGRPVWDMR